MQRGILYYTNNVLDERIFNVVLERLRVLTRGMEVVSVSHKPLALGLNILVDLPSCGESILKQIRIGVENITADILYLVEHDVLYHPSHFEAVPSREQEFLYNRNVYQVDSATGEAIYRQRSAKRTSQLIVHREALKDYLDDVFRRIDRAGYRALIGIAPGSHRIDGVERRRVRGFWSEWPNLDIRHKNNFSQYHPTRNDIPVEEIPYWGKATGRFHDFLAEVGNGHLG